MLTYQAEDPNPSYGHIIVRTQSIDEIAGLIAGMEDFAAMTLPEGEFRAKRLAFGPGGGDPIQVRFSGPDASVLRDLANTAAQRLQAASPDIVAPRIDWREMEQVLRPVYATDRAVLAHERLAIVEVLFWVLIDREEKRAGDQRAGDPP